MSADEVAKAFIPHYYNLFDTNREGLVSLFRETSSLTFEGDGPKTGVAQIMEKLRGLPPARDGATRKLVRVARAHARSPRPSTVPRARRAGRAPAADHRVPAVREPERDPRLLHGPDHGASRRVRSRVRRAPRFAARAPRRALAPAQIEQGKPLKYSEVFQLVASAPGQYYLNNVMFRFNYA